MCFFELNYGHMNQDLRTFVAKTHQSRFTRFWGNILKSKFFLCKKIDIMKLCRPHTGWEKHVFMQPTTKYYLSCF